MVVLFILSKLLMCRRPLFPFSLSSPTPRCLLINFPTLPLAPRRKNTHTGRRDLAASLTKLHAFRLVQYEKVIFLDADTLVLRRLSHLFESPHSFSAAPDQGWPDAFNSGVMVLEPSQESFDGLIDMMKRKGTWDGGDQGLLNDFFPNWNRLSFTYNVTPSAYYT